MHVLHKVKTTCRLWSKRRFGYGSLKPGEIRLLDVLAVSSNRENPLECVLRTTRLPSKTNPLAGTEISGEDGPAGYTTISYVWGDPTPSRHLIINDRVLMVPVNTEELLRRLALKGHRQHLWIDAVCINQQDLQERAEQVSLMGTIYGGSQLNIIWLGESEPELAERAITSIRAVLHDLRKSEYVSIAGYIEADSEVWIRASSPPEYDLDVAAISSLYTQAWFSRLWVVQEAALAPNNTCHLGDLELDCRDVLDAAFWLYQRHIVHLPAEFTDLPGLVNAAQLAEMRHYINQRDSMQIGWLLTSAMTLQVSDERDRVFGMLGLMASEARDSELLRPDYCKSAVDVLRDAVKHSCVYGHEFDTLQYVSHRSEDELDELDRPSWVPMFHRAWHQSYDAGHLTGCFAFTGGLSRVTDLNKHIDPSLLSLDGIAVDEIGSLTSCLFALTEYDDSDVKDMLDIVYEFDDKNTIDRDRLARTLLADTTTLRLRSTPSDWAALESLVDVITEDESTFEAGYQVESALRALIGVCAHRKLAIGVNGHIGLVPKACKPGDILAVLRGPLKPVALRRKGEHYVLLGECYIDEVRDDEQYDQLFANRASEEKVFTLC